MAFVCFLTKTYILLLHGTLIILVIPDVLLNLSAVISNLVFRVSHCFVFMIAVLCRFQRAVDSRARMASRSHSELLVVLVVVIYKPQFEKQDSVTLGTTYNYHRKMVGCS